MKHNGGLPCSSAWLAWSQFMSPRCSISMSSNVHFSQYNNTIYLRKNGNIHPHCSIYWNIQEYSMYIYSDSGRLTRPLIEVSNNMDISLTSNKWDEIITLEDHLEDGGFGSYILECNLKNKSRTLVI